MNTVTMLFLIVVKFTFGDIYFLLSSLILDLKKFLVSLLYLIVF